MYGLQIKLLRFFTITTGLHPIAVFMAVKGNTVRLQSICRSPTNSIWNGTVTVSANGRIGSSTCQVVDAILASKRVEQQSYRSCMGILKLADKYSVDRLEAACRKALSFTAAPSYKSIKNILDTGNDQLEMPDKGAATSSHTEPTKNSHALTRGADYYRR